MTVNLPPKNMELEQIRLRRVRLSDAPAIFEYGSDPEVALYADWLVRTELNAVIDSISEREALWNSGVDFSWVVVTIESDRAIGGIQCKISGDTVELGFLLNKDYWNRGYATAATRAVMEWLYSLPHVSTILATCDTQNLASQRVLEKLGFVQEKRLPEAIVRPQISDLPRDAFVYSKNVKTN